MTQCLMFSSYLGLDGPHDANYRCDILMPDTLVNIPTSSSSASPHPQAPAALQICLNMSRKWSSWWPRTAHNTPPTSRLQTRKICIQNVFNYLCWWCYPTSWGPTWPISKQTIVFSSNLVVMRISTQYVSKSSWIQFAGNIIAITGVNGCCLHQTFPFNHSAQWQQIQILIQFIHIKQIQIQITTTAVQRWRYFDFQKMTFFVIVLDAT